jgi:dihydroorotase
MNILLKNGRLFDPELGTDIAADVLIVDGTIEKISGHIPGGPSDRLVDLSGKVVAPGFLDMHVHLREPGFEYKETIETGCRAAAAGGFTAVACMPNTNPPVDEASVLLGILERARSVHGGIVDVYPVAAVTKGRQGKELSPMMELAQSGAVGFTDDGAPVENAEVLRRAMEYTAMLKKPLIQHAEETSLTRGGVMNEGFVSTSLGMQPMPPVAEEVIIARDILLAEYTGAQYHVAHISTGRSLELVREAKRRSLPVTCEVAPHHFSLTEEAVRSFDTNTKMNPPLRSREDVEAMKEGLRDGTIDAIATDHAPHSFDEKQVEYLYAPFGIVGLETALGLAIRELLIPRILPLAELIKKFTSGPRKVLNLPAVIIREGEKANLTLFDPSTEWVVESSRFHSLSKNTPFEGWKLVGRAYGIVNHGQILLS